MRKLLWMAVAILFFLLALSPVGTHADLSSPLVDHRLRPSHLGCYPHVPDSPLVEGGFHPADNGPVPILDFITIWTNLTPDVWLTVVYNNSLLNVRGIVWILPRENLTVNGRALVQGQSIQWTIKQAGPNLTILRSYPDRLYFVKLRAINSVNDIPELYAEFQAIEDIGFNTAVSWVLQGILAAPFGIWFFSKWRRSRM